MSSFHKYCLYREFLRATAKAMTTMLLHITFYMQAIKENKPRGTANVCDLLKRYEIWFYVPWPRKCFTRKILISKTHEVWKRPIIYNDRCTLHYFLIEINVSKCEYQVNVHSYKHYHRVHYFARARSSLSLYFECSQLPRVYVSLYREVLLKLIRPSNRGRDSVMPVIFGHSITYVGPCYTDQFLSLASERALINISLSQ